MQSYVTVHMLCIIMLGVNCSQNRPARIRHWEGSFPCMEDGGLVPSTTSYSQQEEVIRLSARKLKGGLKCFIQKYLLKEHKRSINQ